MFIFVTPRRFEVYDDCTVSLVKKKEQRRSFSNFQYLDLFRIE